MTTSIYIHYIHREINIIKDNPTNEKVIALICYTNEKGIQCIMIGFERSQI